MGGSSRIGVWLWLFVAVALAVSSSPSVAVSQPLESYVIEGTGYPSAPIARQDALMLAESLRISVDEAIELYSEQNRFNEAVTAVRHLEPSLFVGAGWEAGKGYDAWISFTGQPSESTIAVLSELPISVEIRLDGRATETALDRLLKELVEKVALVKGVTEVSGEWDPRDGSVQLRFAPSTAPVEVAKILENTDAPVSISILPVDRVGNSLQIVRGGLALGSCTSGFTVFQGSTRGVLTAGHCSNTSQNMAGSAYPLPFIGEHRGSYGDFQWHRTVDTTSNQIRISAAGALRAITSLATASVGTAVCNYGKTRTTASCTTVQAISVCSTVSGVTACQLARTSAAFTNGGDSGSPWYFNNTAYGVHYGLTSYLSAYSRVDNAQSILGVTLKLN